jgi:Protein adenylyltransferase SelO
LEPDELAAVFAGNVIPQGAEPIAMAYAAHQFGNFVPQLGDGRAILLGEVLDRDGKRRDIQLKGSGPTPFSRRGDGLAALGPVLREYLVSEAMHALGVPTTRALAAVLTGERVFRERPLPGAVLTRVASSHIRIGTFQYFAARGDIEAVERLSGYVIDRHFPGARDSESPPLALLHTVVERQALLVARWMHMGFIHGVMNTDNTALSGETIDFGPCASSILTIRRSRLAQSTNWGATPTGINRRSRNGILQDSPRLFFHSWIPILSGRSSLQTRRSRNGAGGRSGCWLIYSEESCGDGPTGPLSYPRCHSEVFTVYALACRTGFSI